MTGMSTFIVQDKVIFLRRTSLDQQTIPGLQRRINSQNLAPLRGELIAGLMGRITGDLPFPAAAAALTVA